MMDEEKDKYIKEKFKRDDLISKKADDLFNNFFKEGLNLNNEEMKKQYSNEEKLNKKQKNNKFMKILSIAACFVVLFLGANVYATSKGYENIFFMIRYLVTESTSATKEEILEDRDISISYEPIKITDKISIQIRKLQVESGNAKLIIIINEEELENKVEIVPLEFKVLNEKNEEICYQHSIKKNDSMLMNYTEELNLKDFSIEDNILNLEIYKANKSLVSKIKINIKEQTLEVLGEKEALEKISEIELKEFLGYASSIYNIQKENLGDDERILLVYAYMNLKNISSDDYKLTYKELNDVLEAFGVDKIEKDSFTKKSLYKIVTRNGIEYLEAQYGRGGFSGNTCLNISDLSYFDGMYTVTFTYANFGEESNVDINKFDIYENTLQFKYDSSNEYSKFKIVKFEEARLVQEAEKVEEEDNIQKDEESIPIEDIDISNNDEKEENSSDDNNIIPVDVNNYASTMKWQQYWAPGIKFQYPVEFALEEIGDYYRGSRQGEISTKITGLATGINKETNEIINSNLIISVYEPKAVSKDFNINQYIYGTNGLMYGSFTTKDGLKWINQPIIIEGNGYETEQYIHIEEISDMYWIYKIEFSTDVRANYKVTNIINWFLGNTKLTSY